MVTCISAMCSPPLLVLEDSGSFRSCAHLVREHRHEIRETSDLEDVLVVLGQAAGTYRAALLSCLRQHPDYHRDTCRVDELGTCEVQDQLGASGGLRLVVGLVD